MGASGQALIPRHTYAVAMLPLVHLPSTSIASIPPPAATSAQLHRWLGPASGGGGREDGPEEG